MKATRAARKAAIIEAGMKVHAVLKASLKAQPPTQPSLKNLQKTCMKFVNDLEEFALDKFAHDSPKDVKADSPKDVKAKVKVVRQRVRIVVERERWRRLGGWEGLRLFVFEFLQILHTLHVALLQMIQ